MHQISLSGPDGSRAVELLQKQDSKTQLPGRSSNGAHFHFSPPPPRVAGGIGRGAFLRVCDPFRGSLPRVVVPFCA